VRNLFLNVLTNQLQEQQNQLKRKLCHVLLVIHFISKIGVGGKGGQIIVANENRGSNAGTFI
jgi:hypothetical protein